MQFQEDIERQSRTGLHKLRSGDSLWSELAGESPKYSALSGDIECEVLILGAGITGALLAKYLSHVGVAVALVEGREVGKGSTAASTGLLQYEVDTPLIDLIRQVGEAAAVHSYRRGLAAIDEIEALVSETGDACGYARRASLYFCSHARHVAELEQEFECRRHFGFAVEWLSRQRLAAESSIEADGAILSQGDARIDPLRWTWQLIQTAARNGAQVFAQTQVQRIEESISHVVAHSELGRIRAKKIVYATGYQSEKYLGRPLGALHSTFAVASQPALDIPGWPGECLLWETARPYFYARRTDDGRAIIGGEDTEFATDHDREALVDRQVTRLIERFQALFPGVTFRTECAWAGTFGESKDGLAYIGQLPDRPSAYFALGYGGNGITFSVIAAKLISDLYRGQPNADATVFHFGR